MTIFFIIGNKKDLVLNSLLIFLFIQLNSVILYRENDLITALYNL